MKIIDSIYLRNSLILRIVDLDDIIESVSLLHNKIKYVGIISKNLEFRWDKLRMCKMEADDYIATFNIPLLKKREIYSAVITLKTSKGIVNLSIGNSYTPPKQNIDKQFYKLVDSYYSEFNVKSKLLEIGSRSRSGNIYTKHFRENVEYSGLDIVEGDNVDVVGDAHYLSKLYENNSIDFVYSISTFEHLLCPWIVAVEMNKIMSTGGIAYIQSHQSWPVHEEPADYFRFSKHSWHSLFNTLTGFEILSSSNENPAHIIPCRHELHGRMPQFEYEVGYMMSCCLIKKTSTSKVDWSLNNIPLHELTGKYPD